MPYFNGIETIRMLKSKLKLSTEKQPVILLHSSLDSNQLENDCLELDIRFRLSKPVKSSDLFNYLNNLHKDKGSGIEIEIIKTPLKDNIYNSIKILIAEDVFLNMVLIKAILSDLGFNGGIIEAKNGNEAVEKYQELSPDLILMDVHMPELDGISATKKIRDIELLTGNNIPIIALTAGALKEEREKCFAYGMNDFLTKPLIPEKIKEMLDKYLSNRVLLHEIPPNDESDIDLHMDYGDLINSFKDLSVIKTLMNLALNEIPNQILELESAFMEKNPKAIRPAAHRISGSSINMRFSKMAKIAEELENSSHNKWNENLEHYLTELKAEWEIIKKIIHEKINSLS
jgi:hypothetical protein